MPRSREFDESVALEKAMTVFWQKGFEDTSYDDLVKGTGVSRYGLYTAFGDKYSLFLKALDQYIEEKRCNMVEPLEAEDASLPEIQHYFKQMKKNVGDPKNNVGCMMCNTAIELAHFDDRAKKRIERIFSELKRLMTRALKNAREKGEVSKDLNPEQTADFLVGLMMGAPMLMRSPMARTQIVNYIDNGLKVLERP